MQKIVDGYVFLSVAGHGMFGEVYKARKVDSGEYFAVKMFQNVKVQSSPEYQEMLIDEIQNLRRVEHRCIVKFWRWLKTINHIYFVYDYCSGGTLDNLIRKETRLEEQYALHCITRQIVEALLVLKEHGIVHNDIKPSNILFKHENMQDVVIADFGFSKYIATSQVQSKSIRGSPIYMAPEVLEGADLDFSVDVYSLGVLLFEMLQGKCPFEETDINKLTQKKREAITFTYPLSEFARSLCKDMLNVNPLHRITIEELALKLNITRQLESVLPDQTGQIHRNESDNTLIQSKDNRQVTVQPEYQPMITFLDQQSPSVILTTQRTQSQKQIGKNQSQSEHIEERRKIKQELGLESQLVRPFSDHISMTQSQTSQEMILDVSRRLLRERNKVIYVNNVVSAVIDLNLYENSFQLAVLLLKEMLDLSSKLLFQLRSPQLTDFKISPSHWSKFRMSPDYDIFNNTLLSEHSQMQLTYQAFLAQLTPEQVNYFQVFQENMKNSTKKGMNDLENASNSQSGTHNAPSIIPNSKNSLTKMKANLESSTNNINTINPWSPEDNLKISSSIENIMNNASGFRDVCFKEYCQKVKERVMELEKSNENTLAYRMLMHLNNVLDGIHIDDFFSSFILDGIQRLPLQTYFRVIQSLSYEDLTNLIAFKLQSFVP